MNNIDIYIDGGSRPEGASFGVYIKSTNILMAKYVDKATNNQMELCAFISALLLVDKYSEQSDNITIYCDSMYVINGINDWLDNWIKTNWKTSSGKDVKNVAYWKCIDRLLENLRGVANYRILHVKGHSGNRGNEVVDQICTGSIVEAKDICNTTSGIFNNSLEIVYKKFFRETKKDKPKDNSLGTFRLFPFSSSLADQGQAIIYEGKPCILIKI